MKVQHLVVTRYTVKNLFYDEFSPAWLEGRLRLFRTYCVPSMERQTFRNYNWLVLCDETTDRNYIEEIRQAAASVPQLRIARTSPGRGSRIRRAITPFVEEDTDILIMTRLDSDDSLHREYLATVDAYSERFIGSPYERWILIFSHGYRYDEAGGRLYATFWPHCPFQSMFERLRPPDKRFSGVYQRNHHQHHLKIPVHFDQSIPGWLQVIHGRAESTEPRAGAVLTSGNWGTRINRDDLEVDSAEAARGFDFLLANRNSDQGIGRA